MYEILSQLAARIGGTTFAAGPGVTVTNVRFSGAASRGVFLTFNNGFLLALRWGTSNACGAAGVLDTNVSPTAEVSVWSEGFVLVSEVIGFVPADEALALIPRVMGLSPDVQFVNLADLLLPVAV
jgi:hypothetical protein